MTKVIITMYIKGEAVETTKFYRSNWTDFAICEFVRKDAIVAGAESYAVKIER